MKKVLATLENPDSIKILLIVALLFRLVLIPNPGFEADITFWKSWGLAVRDFGIVKGLPLTNFNYPTPFAYLLGLMANIYSFFADPHNYNQFWTNSNILFLAIAKTPSILADFGIFGVFVWIGKNAKRIAFPTFPYIFFVLVGLLYLFNPLGMFDGALWGQVDSVGMFLFLIANCLVLTKKPFLAGVVYMVSMLSKLQYMIYGPVFFLFVWQYLGLDGLMQSVAGSAVAFFGLNIEFIKAKNMDRVIGDLTGNYDYFPWLSLNAYNVWWIFSGAHGMPNSDKVAAIGITNAKTVGLYMFASTYLLAVLFMFWETVTKILKAKPGVDVQRTLNPVDVRTMIFRYFTALIITTSAFFLFQTEAHDRYAYPISVFLLLWAPFFFAVFDIKNLATIFHEKIFKQFLIGYLGFTLLYFYNMHNAFLANYPNNGITILNALNKPVFTIAASYAQIALFFYFLYILRKHLTPLLFFIWVSAFIVLITTSNLPILLKKPVYITKLTPISSSAGYGKRQVNMPVDATYGGFTKWGFLSVQYAYYRFGLGTHAPSREVFDINRQFKTLSTDMGIDTDAGPQGSVQFLVYGDGKKLYESDLITRYEFPRHAQVNVTGVKTLELIITDGGNGITDDHADWLNTQLIP